MTKKSKDKGPNPNNVANKDIIQRLNFLYQASVFLSGIPDSSYCNRSRRKRRYFTAGDLSRAYIGSMKTVGKKTTVKIDPTVKRTLCKGCSTVLVPGATAYVRVKASSSHRHAVTYTCIVCQTSRRLPAPQTLDREQHTTVQTEMSTTPTLPISTSSP